MQKTGDWTNPEIVDVVIIFLSTSHPHVAMTDPALYQALVSQALGHICIPPLRTRPEDILLFLQYFLRKAGLVYMRQELSCEKNFEDEALLMIVDHQWPDNVLGVKHFIDFLIFAGSLNSSGDQITAYQAEQAFKIQYGANVGRPFPPPDSGFVRPPGHLGKRPLRPNNDQLWPLYRDYIRDGGLSQAELATALGVHESTLSRWFTEAGIPSRPRGRRPKSSRPKPPSYPTS
jgi:DNA-binding NtrC family response regulator